MRRDTGLGSSRVTGIGAGASSQRPTTAPAMMIATCENGVAQASATAAATTARARRGQSGASAPAITQTACATTATAATFRPWTQPAPDRSVDAANSPSAVSATADGSVNPSQAATPPAIPARRVPMAMPSWLLAGPGRIWDSVTRSVKASSSSQPRRATYSRRKYPIWAIGPPNDVRPSRRAATKTSPIARGRAVTPSRRPRPCPPVRPGRPRSSRAGSSRGTAASTSSSRRAASSRPAAGCSG